MNELVATLLEQRPGQTTTLGALVGRKTGNNFYFVTQYMEHLHDLNLISFSFQTNKWEWDLKQIEAKTNVSANVVSLLTIKMNHMPASVRTLLMIASCLGFSSDRGALETIVLAEDLLSGDGVEEQDALPEDDRLEQPAHHDSILVSGEPETKSDFNDARERFNKAFDGALKAGLIEPTTVVGKYNFLTIGCSKQLIA